MRGSATTTVIVLALTAGCHSGWEAPATRGRKAYNTFEGGRIHLTEAQRDNPLIVFWGNSITEQGYYVEAVENFFAVAMRERPVRFFNAGTGGNTYESGLARFDSDVKARDPDIVVVEFGINDAAYAPFDESRYRAFATNVRSALTRLIEETSAHVYVLSPSYYDADAEYLAGKTASPSRPYYDEVLRRYSEAQQGIVDDFLERVTFVDIRTLMKKITLAQRNTDPSFTLVPDKVHPSRLGGVVIADSVIRAMTTGREEWFIGLSLQPEMPFATRSSSYWYSPEILNGIPLPLHSDELALFRAMLPNSPVTRFYVRTTNAKSDDVFDVRLIFEPAPNHGDAPTTGGESCLQHGVSGHEFNVGLELDYDCYATWQARMERILRLSDNRRRFVQQLRLRTHGPKAISDPAARAKAFSDLARELAPQYLEAERMYLQIRSEAGAVAEVHVFRR